MSILMNHLALCGLEIYGIEKIQLLIKAAQHSSEIAGIIYLLCYGGIRDQQQIAYTISIANAIFLLGYCALIYKMLASTGMIGINLVTLIWLTSNYLG